MALQRWLHGGIKGIIICLILFLFYIVIYFPFINIVYAEDRSAYGGTPSWTMILPTITGHFFPIFSHFLEPSSFLCPFTETICIHWSATAEPESTPWRLETGEEGYCVEQATAPTTSCADFSEKIVFFSFTFLLLAAYFSGGAIIAWLREKRKMKI